jgi:hypothetical protein
LVVPVAGVAVVEVVVVVVVVIAAVVVVVVAAVGELGALAVVPCVEALSRLRGVWYYTNQLVSKVSVTNKGPRREGELLHFLGRLVPRRDRDWKMLAVRLVLWAVERRAISRSRRGRHRRGFVRNRPWFGWGVTCQEYGDGLGRVR